VSAFVVDYTHIDVLVTAALAFAAQLAHDLVLRRRDRDAASIGPRLRCLVLTSPESKTSRQAWHPGSNQAGDQAEGEASAHHPHAAGMR
jgi:hypothetical protein